MTILFIYNLSVTVGLANYFGLIKYYTDTDDHIVRVEFPILIVQDVFYLIVYICLRLVYMGFSHYSGRKNENTSSTNNAEESQTLKSNAELRHNRKLTEQEFSIHWTGSVARIIRSSYHEIVYIVTGKSIQKKPFLVPLNKPYYQLLNTALKFLTRHNALSVEEINFNRRLYRVLLLIILYGSFIVTFVFQIALMVQKYNQNCFTNLIIIDAICQYNKYMLIFLLGGTVQSIYITGFRITVMMSLVGLGYGAEVGYRMTKSWLLRFGQLRKLNSNSQSIRTTRDANDPTVITDNIENNKKSNQGLNVSFSDIIPHISRDSFEHYLYLRRYMQIAGNVWSVPIFGMFLLAILLSLNNILDFYKYYATIDAQGWASAVIGISFNVLILFIVPLSCIAHANSCTYPLKKAFLAAAPEDFSIIGGRDKWLKFVDENPVVWSFFGLAITWERLGGFFSSVIFVVGVALLVYKITDGKSA